MDLLCHIYEKNKAYTIQQEKKKKWQTIIDWNISHYMRRNFCYKHIFFITESPTTFPDGQVVAVPWGSPYALQLVSHFSD